MTLSELIEAHPDKFYKQDWYRGEAFMHTNAAPRLQMPDAVVHEDARKSPELAVNLAALWLDHPESPIWNRYLWCYDTDSLGQQVYVGVNNGKFEIHRHIHLTERFGVPIWS